VLRPFVAVGVAVKDKLTVPEYRVTVALAASTAVTVNVKAEPAVKEVEAVETVKEEG
jgi:hypothetical protein